MRASFILAFLLVSIASVSSLNLNDLDTLSTNDVTPGCLSTYSQDISECPSAANFKEKKTCTSSCIDALKTRQQAVILACRQAFVHPDSLLRRLMDGGLAITLCPAIKSSSTSSASAATTSFTEAEISSPVASPTSDSVSGFLTLTVSSADTSITSVPSELTLDSSTEPTVSAYALNLGTSSTSSTAVESPISTASGGGAPFQAAAGNSTNGGQQSDTNGAGVVKAVWATVGIGFSVALGVSLL